MKKLTGMIVSAALLFVAQTSMAYTYNGQVRLNGFSSEGDALNAGKQVVREFADGTRKITPLEVSHYCCLFVDNLQVIDVQINKRFKSTGNDLQETFESIVNYEYDCEEINLP